MYNTFQLHKREATATTKIKIKLKIVMKKQPLPRGRPTCISTINHLVGTERLKSKYILTFLIGTIVLLLGISISRVEVEAEVAIKNLATATGFSQLDKTINYQRSQSFRSKLTIVENPLGHPAISYQAFLLFAISYFYFQALVLESFSFCFRFQNIKELTTSVIKICIIYLIN